MIAALCRPSPKTKQFPGRAALVKFGRIVCKMTGTEVERELNDIATGVELAALELQHYCEQYPDFNLACGDQMQKSLQAGMRYTLGL